jgi:hypothetical protein
VAKPFYSRLNETLIKHEHRFDLFAEAACRGFYAERMGDRSCRPPESIFSSV